MKGCTYKLIRNHSERHKYVIIKYNDVNFYSEIIVSLILNALYRKSDSFLILSWLVEANSKLSLNQQGFFTEL